MGCTRNNVMSLSAQAASPRLAYLLRPEDTQSHLRPAGSLHRNHASTVPLRNPGNRNLRCCTTVIHRRLGCPLRNARDSCLKQLTRSLSESDEGAVYRLALARKPGKTVASLFLRLTKLSRARAGTSSTQSEL
jgi:hypothetical protein